MADDPAVPAPEGDLAVTDAAEAPGDGSTSPAAAAARRPRPRLDRRTIGICVALAVIGGLIAAIITAWALTREEETPSNTDKVVLTDPTGINPITLAAAPLTTPDGTETTLRDLSGPKRMVVNLWADWCAPCVKEMPMLDEVSQEHTDLDFLGVNVDPEQHKDRAVKRAASTGITYPWVLDPTGAFREAAEVVNMPLTLLIDTNGNILATRSGAFADKADLTGWLDDALS